MYKRISWTYEFIMIYNSCIGSLPLRLERHPYVLQMFEDTLAFRKIWICVHAFINHYLLNLKIESQGEGGTSRRKMLLSLVIWNLYFWSKNTLQTSNTPSNWTVDKLRVWDSHKLTCMIVISVTCNNLHRYPRNLTIKGVQLTTPYLAMLTLF